MFDLEEKISTWRKQMLKGGVESASLTELESHLREEIERQIRQGLPAERAFELAVEKIGSARELKEEFKKAGESLESRLIKLLGIGCVAVAFLFSLWIVPFLFHNETGLVAKFFGVTAFAVTILSFRYNDKFLPVIRKSRTRAAIGFLCCVGCLIWIRFFIVNFLPNVIVHPAGKEIPAGYLMAIFLWAWTIMAVLGGIGYGLEKAARKSIAP